MECYNKCFNRLNISLDYFRLLGQVILSHTERLRLASRAVFCAASSLKYLNLEIIEEFCKSELSELKLSLKWLNGENIDLRVDLRVDVRVDIDVDNGQGRVRFVKVGKLFFLYNSN